MKNSKAKNVRNFNGLYDARQQSDKLRDMQEKYRIGEGKKDRIQSLNTSIQFQKYMTDGVTDNSIMQTGQAFFSNKSNHLAYQNINNQQYIKFTDKNLPPLGS